MVSTLIATSPVYTETLNVKATKYIQDLSLNPRLGLKGKNVAEELLKQGFEIPKKPNQSISHNNIDIVRLIGNEYWLLSADENADLPKIDDQEGCYHFPCEDGFAWFRLNLAENIGLMANVCPVDLSDMLVGDVVQTTIAGINVKLINQQIDGSSVLSLFCDRSMANYLVYVFNDLIEPIV